MPWELSTLDRPVTASSEKDAEFEARYGLLVALLGGEEGEASLLRMIDDASAAASLDLEAVNQRGQTALFLAAWCGHATLVRRLLELGADATTKDHSCATPTIIAVCEGHTDVLDALLSSGRPLALEVVSTASMTALATACVLVREDAVCRLLDAGADPSPALRHFRTPASMRLLLAEAVAAGPGRRGANLRWRWRRRVVLWCLAALTTK